MTASETSWYVDPDGWLRSPSGTKLGRITPAGELYLWDTRSRCERRLLLADLARLIEQEKRKAA